MTTQWILTRDGALVTQDGSGNVREVILNARPGVSKCSPVERSILDTAFAALLGEDRAPFTPKG